MNWKPLSYSKAKDTYETLHLWLQIIGKIKLSRLPWINHSWHVTLQVTPSGLTTGVIPDDKGHFQIDVDIMKNLLIIKTETGKRSEIALHTMTVADFYASVMDSFKKLGIDIKINTTPCEIMNPIPFEKDTRHSIYDSVAAQDLQTALVCSNEVFTKFRAGFIGKSSPVHFFWGGADLAVSRFSGRTAPKHPGGMPNLPDRVVQEAYSHEVYSCGFWPGNEMVPYASYYAYIYPEPDGFSESLILPKGSFYHPELREFMLPYEIVQKSSDASGTLMQFLTTTYDAAATLAHWDRSVLEKTF